MFCLAIFVTGAALLYCELVHPGLRLQMSGSKRVAWAAANTPMDFKLVGLAWMAQACLCFDIVQIACR